MADEFYLVQIGSVYLTDTGISSGMPCLNRVDGLAELFSSYSGATVKSLRGVPKTFTFDNEGMGVNLITRPFAIKKSVGLSGIKTLINASISGNSDIQVTISDGPGAVDVYCRPLFEGSLPPIMFKDNFFNEDLFDCEIRLVTNGFVPAGP